MWFKNYFKNLYVWKIKNSKPTFWKEDAAGLEVDDLHVEVGATGDNTIRVRAEPDPVDLKINKKIAFIQLWQLYNWNL